ncbi:MAG: Gfo/Idh/MocA family oxidoreductase [Planctomycetota bacterium]|nr:Gfo/Idh/MocA family oxidoreductase [Planctomycetota bacterium]
MTELRIAIIGAGQISQSCCKAADKHDSATVVAAFDPSPGRLKELCDEFKIPTACSSAEDMLALDNVDAVYVAVPNKFHAPYAKQALEAGKHVILDKPFALSYDEAKAVADAAEANGKLFMLGMNQRYRTDSQKIRNLVSTGRLGEIYHAKAFWFRRSGIPKLGTWFGNKDLAGGGALLDIGVHLLDLCLHLSGNWNPVSVTGATYTKFGNRGLGEGSWGKSDKEDILFNVDDFASALIKFDNGATVTLDVSWACHAEEPNRNDVHLYGTEGGASTYPAKLFHYGAEGEDYQVVEDPEADIALEHADRFHNFFNAILGTEQPLTSVEEALTVQRILDAIYASCASGKEVRLD